MGRVKDHMQDWLEEYGHKLGYDMKNCPNLEDFWWIVDNHVDAEEYWEGRWNENKKWK